VSLSIMISSGGQRLRLAAEDTVTVSLSIMISRYQKATGIAVWQASYASFSGPPLVLSRDSGRRPTDASL
jgi:hypothetical protein